ncbi:hypothetical protein [Levilactobacillus yonginensis]|uniref:hypothetical protein n=1 Tax=Levilactobacillus yonginensis TaxID=1054041 RepID=UPI0013DE5399|nr:hypothetical protein [Levilactobacillus yonginensis]
MPGEYIWGRGDVSRIGASGAHYSVSGQNGRVKSLEEHVTLPTTKLQFGAFK